MNLDRPGLQFHGFAVARQVIGAFALDLDRRILRRDLLDQAGKAGQQFPDRLGGGPERAGLGDPPLGVVGVAFLVLVVGIVGLISMRSLGNAATAIGDRKSVV